jgi:hypothetical protein
MDSILELLARSVEELIGRVHGPLRFRLFVMPTVVVVLAVRAHLRDVRAGKPVLVGAFFTSPSERRRLLRSALRDIGKVLVVALVLDTTYQVVFLRAFFFGQALIVALVCAVVPYVVVRGPVTRLWHHIQKRRGGAARTSAVTAGPDVEGREGEE